jgi:hypothetical protein
MDAVHERNGKVLQFSTRGSNLPTTSSSRPPSPSPSPSRSPRSLPSRSLQRSRGSLSRRRSLDSLQRILCRLERRRNLCSPRSRVRSRSLFAQQRVVCLTGGFRGLLYRRDGTSPG